MLPRGVVRGRRNPLHFGFSVRLARARKAAGMTGSALSLAVGMARNAASHLEVKDRVPRVDTVEKLASVLHVSPGFLAFGVEHPFELAAESVSAGLAMRLGQIRQERAFSYRELARLSQTSHKFIQMTETGATVPSIAKVEQLAQALAVSPSWLAFGIGERDFAPPRRTRAAAATVQPA